MCHNISPLPVTKLRDSLFGHKIKFMCHNKPQVGEEGLGEVLRVNITVLLFHGGGSSIRD